jgi:hypothetical protein
MNLEKMKTPDPIDVLIRRMERCEAERARLRAESGRADIETARLTDIERRRSRLLHRKLRLAKSAVVIARISEANRLTREAC